MVRLALVWKGLRAFSFSAILCCFSPFSIVYKTTATHTILQYRARLASSWKSLVDLDSDAVFPPFFVVIILWDIFASNFIFAILYFGLFFGIVCSWMNSEIKSMWWAEYHFFPRQLFLAKLTFSFLFSFFPRLNCLDKWKGFGCQVLPIKFFTSSSFCSRRPRPKIVHYWTFFIVVELELFSGCKSRKSRLSSWHRWDTWDSTFWMFPISVSR